MVKVAVKYRLKIIYETVYRMADQHILHADAQRHKKLVASAAYFFAVSLAPGVADGAAEGIAGTHRPPEFFQIAVEHIDIENRFLHRIVKVGDAVRNIVRRLHYPGKRKTVMLFQLRGSAQLGDVMAFGKIKARLFHQGGELRGLVALPPGGRGIFQNAGDLAVGQIKLQQRVHQADRLRIAFEVTEILPDHRIQLVKAVALLIPFDAGDQRIHQLRRQIGVKPVVDRRLAEMAERRIAYVMQQTGHLDQAFKRARQLLEAVLFQPALIFQGFEDLFGDIASGLLHLQRMGQTRAHRGIALQRKNLRFLLQTSNSGRVDNAPAIAFKVTGNGIFPLRRFPTVPRPLKADSLPEINLLHPFHLVSA